MSYESKEGESNKLTSGYRGVKKEVQLFPGLADRKGYPTPMNQGVSTRLGTNISIFEPLSYEEALEIVECLRMRAATTISLDKMKKMDAGRLVDFVAGASAALDGNFHKLTEQVYVFCPSNISIVAPSQTPAATSSKANPLDFLYNEKAEDKGSFSAIWNKS